MSNGFTVVDGIVGVKHINKVVAENYSNVNSPGQTYTHAFIRSATIDRIFISCDANIRFQFKIFADSSKAHESIVIHMDSKEDNFIHVNKLGIDAIFQNSNIYIEILHDSITPVSFKMRIHAKAQR